MSASRSDSHGPPTRPAKAVVIPADRRALIEAQVTILAATARKVAVTLPLSADASDFVRVLEEAGRP